MLAGLVGGGVFLLAGVVMFVVGGNVTTKSEKPASKLRVLPWVGPQTAGLGVIGTF
jgi:hypothetical protein